jgi:hypothetical protein
VEGFRLGIAEGWSRVHEQNTECKRDFHIDILIHTASIPSVKYLPEGFYKLKDLPPGEYFKKSPTARTVYVRGHYDRTDKRYYFSDAEDMNREGSAKGSTVVFAGFTY